MMFIYKFAKFTSVLTNIREILEIFVHSMIADHALCHQKGPVKYLSPTHQVDRLPQFQF